MVIHCQVLIKVGWLKKLMLVLVVISILLVSTEGERLMKVDTVTITVTDEEIIKSPTPSIQGKEEKEVQNQRSFDAFLSSKRRVPNASDPLHNR